MTVNERKDRSAEEFLFKTLAFLASSAKGCINEPQLYGSFRLLDTMSKLCDFPEYSDEIHKDKFLDEIKQEIDEKKFLFLDDEHAYKEFIKQLVETFAREYKNRKLKDDTL